MGGLICDGCGLAIDEAAVAVAVDFVYTTHPKVPRRERPDWACASCASRATPARLKPTSRGDGLWCPYPTVDPPFDLQGLRPTCGPSAESEAHPGYVLARVRYPQQTLAPGEQSFDVHSAVRTMRPSHAERPGRSQVLLVAV